MPDNAPPWVPLLSFCVPTYNRAQDLRRCLESLLSQSGDFEVVVSDNASPDDTPKVIEDMADERLRYRRRASNGGLARNFVDVIEEARGDYVCLVTDDDYALPGSIPKLERWIDGNRPDVAKCDLIKTNIVSRSVAYVSLDREILPDDPAPDDVVDLFKVANIWTGFIFRRELVSEELLHEALSTHYPTFLILAALGGRPGYLPAPIFVHTWENETFWAADPREVSSRFFGHDIALALTRFGSEIRPEQAMRISRFAARERGLNRHLLALPRTTLIQLCLSCVAGTAIRWAKHLLPPIVAQKLAAVRRRSR